MPVLVAAVVAGLLVAAAYAGSGALALAVVGAQAVLAYGVMTARPAGAGAAAAGDVTTRGRAGALVTAAGAASVLSHRLAEPDPAGPSVEPALWVLGTSVVLAMLLELVRRDGRERLVESLSATVAGVALAVMLGLLVAAEELAPLDEVSVGYAAGGALVGVVVWWLCTATATASRWRWPSRLLAVAALAGAGVAAWLVEIPDVDLDQQLVLGGVVAVTGLVGAGAGRQLGGDTASRSALMPTVALALTSPAVYLAARLLFW